MLFYDKNYNTIRENSEVIVAIEDKTFKCIAFYEENKLVLESKEDANTKFEYIYSNDNCLLDHIETKEVEDTFTESLNEGWL